MPIPESQLTTWSSQGSVTQSATTYQIIKNALEAQNSGYADKAFDVFLQGSYANYTNVYAESDVDVVICLRTTFRYDLNNLADAEKEAYRNYVDPATYRFDDFKRGVIAHLRQRFPISVGNKAVTIPGDNNRRNADVIICQEYRNFHSFNFQRTWDYASGVAFQTPQGEIVNYPEQHSENLTAKHQVTQYRLKPVVRILKNIRNRLVRDGILQDGIAASYFIEGMLYSVPDENFVSSHADTFYNCVSWLQTTDRSRLLCANRQYWLLGNSNVQWSAANCDLFLTALVDLWNNW
jgi:hypothetical protein